MTNDNECCQCHERGSVWNKHSNFNRETSTPIPIHWVCTECRRHVCINCVYTIPGSQPLQIAEPTSCSEACRKTWLTKNNLPDDYEG